MKQKNQDLLDIALVRRKANTKELREEFNNLMKTLPLFNSSIKSSIREIRLKRLADTTAKILAKERNKISTPKKNVEKTAEELAHERLLYARRRGNEYSRNAVQQSFYAASQNYLNYLPIKRGETTAQEIVRERWRYARQRGNHFAKLAKETKPLDGQESGGKLSDTNNTSAKKVLYGNYYNARNKLVYKDSIGEYDQEFHALLLKCAVFEKEHDDVRGFLQERIFKGTWSPLLKDISSGKVDSRKIIAAKAEPPPITVQPKNSAASIVLRESSADPDVKEIGVQVSEESLSKSSDGWCEAEPITENISQERIFFEDVKKSSEERLAFGDIDRISEEKDIFENAEKLSKDDLAFGDVNVEDVEKKDVIDRIGDHP